MPNSYSGGSLKSFTVTFPAKGAVSSVAVVVSANSPTRALAVARQAVHDMLDTGSATLA